LKIENKKKRKLNFFSGGKASPRCECLLILPIFDYFKKIHKASASDDSTVKIWNMTTATLKYTLSHTQAVRSLVKLNTTTTTELLASGSVDGIIKIWHT
jgi:WD40 repeat protein